MQDAVIFRHLGSDLNDCNIHNILSHGESLSIEI